MGANAFAHESGIHQDGMLKNKETYEIITPEEIGLVRADEAGIVMGESLYTPISVSLHRAAVWIYMLGVQCPSVCRINAVSLPLAQGYWDYSCANARLYDTH